MRLNIAEAAYRLAGCPDFDLWVPSRDRSVQVLYRVERIREWDEVQRMLTIPEGEEGLWEIKGPYFDANWTTLRHIGRMAGLSCADGSPALLRGFDIRLTAALWRTTLVGWPK